MSSSNRRPHFLSRRAGVLAIALCLTLAAQAAAAATSDEPSGGEVNPAYEPLAWLVGEWQAEFRPRGEDLAAPTMAFTWGDANHSFLRMTGTTPAPGGGLEPEYESTVVWHPVERRFVFLGVYRAGGGRVTETGDVEILDDGAVRLHMNVHYPPGEAVPFSDGLTAGPEGHTLEFRRTFHRHGADGLRGFFRIRRGERWEAPHPGAPEDGYPWRRVPPPSATEAAAPPPWVLAHWGRLVGRWSADNSRYRNDQETTEAYGLEWSWGIGKTSLVGRLFALEGGEETATLWEFREFWHPGSGRLTTEQFGAGGTYGVGHQERSADGSLAMEQVFYYPSAGATARVGHRSTRDGDEHTTTSFDIDEDGGWSERRTYVWERQAADKAAKESGE